MAPMIARAQLGRIGEAMAARHLESRGLAVVARNWRPRQRGPWGELDLVALDGGVLVVCEVKARRGTGAGHPLEALTVEKVARLRRLAGAFVAEAAGRTVEGTPIEGVRVDAIAVAWPDGGGRAEIEHVEAVG
jgi:putative endonuclease